MLAQRHFISLNPPVRFVLHYLDISRDDFEIVLNPKCTPNIIVSVSKPCKTMSAKYSIAV